MRNREVGFAVCLLLAAACMFVLTSPLSAQDATGIVLGTVTDPQGSVIPGAQVTVTNTGTQQKTTALTGPDGSYRVTNLPIGSYIVSAEHTGFTTVRTQPQKLQINQSLRFDIKLQVGSAQTTVEVAADAAQVETVNSTLGNSVTSRPLVDLPLNGRNVLQLALLQPGVTETNPDSTAAGDFSVAGGRTDSVTYLLDGGINNNLLDNGVVYSPNPDTIAEFRILQNNYTAEYGRNGGGVVSVVTKSGTNNFHGSLFEFLRNDAFNANSYFNKLNGAPRDVLKRNQFGGTLGGPIVKDKFFFFIGYQGQLLSQTIPTPDGQVTTFTPQELNGDFSNSAQSEKDNVSAFLTANPSFIAPGHSATDAVINPTMIDPVAKAYITNGLVPSSPAGLLTPYGKGKDNRNELTMKFDYSATSNDKFSVTLGGTRINILSPFIFANVNGYPNTDHDNNYFANIAYTRTFTNALLNEFRFTAQRNNNGQRYVGATLPTASDLGVGITPDNPTGPPNILFDTGLALGFSEQGPTNLVNNTFSYQDTFSWVKGHHTWKFGAGFTPYENNTVYDFYVNGEFDFANLSDFLLGNPYALYQYPQAPSNIRSKNTYLFAQDEWHIGRRLVLNLGVRYEYSTPKLDTAGRSFSYIQGLQSTRFPNAPSGLVFPGDAGAPRGANFPDRNDWAPRFGFAWDPKGDAKMSIRGGFGVFYDILKGEDNLQFNGQPPFFSSVGLFFDPPTGVTGNTGYLTDPFGTTGTVNPFPSHPPASNIDFAAAGFLPINTGGAVYLVDPHLRTPYTFQYNLNLQRELGKDTVGEVAYVGSTSHKLTSLVDINPINPSTLRPVFNSDGSFSNITGDRIINQLPANQACNALVDYCYASLPEFRNVVNANYNALETSITRQPTDTGFMGKTYFTLAYTWSHNIDNSSGFRERNSQVPYFDPNYFRASADLDVRHRITFSGGWDMPIEQWTGAKNRLTQGWSWYPILSWRTGFPIDIPAYFPNRFDPTEAGPSGAGDPYLAYANAVGPTNTGLNIQPGAVYWFNPASFSRDCEYVDAADGCATGYGSAYGNLRRNSLRGPSRTNFDLALAKVTKLTEAVSLQFRAEAFNVFNHAEFDNPKTDIRNDATFGQITTTADPRILQFAVRVVF